MLSRVFNSVLFGIYVLRNVVALYALDGDVSLWYGIIANLAYTAGLYILQQQIQPKKLEESPGLKLIQSMQFSDALKNAVSSSESMYCDVRGNGLWMIIPVRQVVLSFACRRCSVLGRRIRKCRMDRGNHRTGRPW